MPELKLSCEIDNFLSFLLVIGLYKNFNMSIYVIFFANCMRNCISEENKGVKPQVLTFGFLLDAFGYQPQLDRYFTDRPDDSPVHQIVQVQVASGWIYSFRLSVYRLHPDLWRLVRPGSDRNCQVGWFDADPDTVGSGYRRGAAHRCGAGARQAFGNAHRQIGVRGVYRVLARRSADHRVVHVIGNVAAVFSRRD